MSYSTETSDYVSSCCARVPDCSQQPYLIYHGGKAWCSVSWPLIRHFALVRTIMHVHLPIAAAALFCCQPQRPLSMCDTMGVMCQRKRAAEAARRISNCASCDAALAELEMLDEGNLTWILGANAINAAMRRCVSSPDVAERLFLRLGDQTDIASFEIIAAARLESDHLDEAAVAVAAALSLVPERERCGVRLTKIARRTLDACALAGVSAAGIPMLWRRLDDRGALPPGFNFRGGTGTPANGARDGKLVHLHLERTLAVLKPDALRQGYEEEIISLLMDSGFEVVAQRRFRMSESEAAAFLSVSWGSAKRGNMRRRFFADMCRFYASGDVLAILLERHGAVSAWRSLLGGHGDPAMCRQLAPSSVRARWGTNKQQNAAHGADSVAAAAREISHVFGDGYSAPRTADVHAGQPGRGAQMATASADARTCARAERLRRRLIRTAVR